MVENETVYQKRASSHSGAHWVSCLFRPTPAVNLVVGKCKHKDWYS